jgi:hypothetical protein
MKVESMALRRLLAMSGVVSPVLIALAFFVVSGSTPDEKASAAKVVSFYHDHQTSNRVAALMVAIGGVLLVLFAARLRELLGDGTPDGGILPSAAFGGAVIAAAGAAFMAAVHFALVQAGQHGFAEPAQTLNVLDDNDFFVLLAGLTVFFIAAGIAIVRRPQLPRWLGWVAIVIGILAMAGPVGFFGLLLGLLWILGVAIFLAVRSESRSDEPAEVESPART